MVALVGQVMLLLGVVLLMVEVMVLMVMRVRGRRWCLAGGRVRQGPDFGFSSGYGHSSCAAVRFYALVLQVVVPGVALVMVVMVLHRVVKGMLAPSRVLLEVQVVLVVEVLVVLQVLCFHVPHWLCGQTVVRRLSKFIFVYEGRMVKILNSYCADCFKSCYGKPSSDTRRFLYRVIKLFETVYTTKFHSTKVQRCVEVT